MFYYQLLIHFGVENKCMAFVYPDWNMYLDRIHEFNFVLLNMGYYMFCIYVLYIAVDCLFDRVWSFIE